jgi:hypothetical protein
LSPLSFYAPASADSQHPGCRADGAWSILLQATSVSFYP